MRIFRFFFPAVFFMFCISALGAANITVTVVQNEDAPSIALEMSQTIEDEMLGNYFEYGHIVSNTGIRFDGIKFVEKNFGVKEAAFGLSDYLVAVFLQYGPAEIINSEKKTSYAELNKVLWRVVHVLSSAVIAENTIDATKIKVIDFDPYKQARLVADQVSSESLKALQNRKSGEKK